MFQLGPITLSTGINFPILSQILIVLVDLHLFLSKFSSFNTICLIFVVSIFRLLYPPLTGVSLKCSDFRTRLQPKIGSLAKSFLLAPPSNTGNFQKNFLTLSPKSISLRVPGRGSWNTHTIPVRLKLLSNGIVISYGHR